MRATLVLTGLGLVAAMGLCLIAGNGCAGDGPDELPPEELETAAPPRPAPAPAVAAAPAVLPPAASRPPLPPLAESHFDPLSLRGTKGGQLEVEIDGSPADVAEMLLDFEGANGVRPWARTYRRISRSENTTRAEWHFKGKMGVHPKVVLALVRTDAADGSVRIRFKLERTALGIAAFFGDWKIRPVLGRPGRSRLTSRIFIDSGLPLVNASSKDIEDGLRDDAAKMRSWMRRRLGVEGSTR